MQPDQRDTVPARDLLGVDALAQPSRGGRAARDGEVLAADYAVPSVDPPRAEHKVAGGEVDELARFVPLGMTRKGADFAKAVRVKQGVDAFADRQPTLCVLTRNGLRAALCSCERAYPLGLIEPFVPTHGVCGSAYPSSDNISRVCSPKAGAPRRMLVGVAEKRAAARVCRRRPASG